MALRYSTGAAQLMASRGSFRDAFQNGKIEIYSGAQPATPDAAVTGVLLCTITESSLTRTAEVLASGTVTLTGGASGTVDTLTVNSIDILGGAVTFTSTLTATAAAVALKCQNFKGSTEYNVTSSGAVITITALPGTGAVPNGFVVASTTTTITKTDVNLASGVAAVNGLKFLGAVAGVISKDTTAWTGVNVATGTAGYYRLYGSVADTGAIDSALTTIREDGAIATGSSQLDMAGGTSLTNTATTTIDSFTRTIPTA